MAYTGFGENFETAKTAAPLGLRAWIASWFNAVVADDEVLAAPVQRKLAGPDPLDRRTNGYMADLDMEMTA